MVFVVLFEEPVEAAEMVGGLGKTLSDSRGDISPFTECEVDFLGVLALFPGDGAEERQDVLGYVILNSGAVAHGVHISKRCSDKAEVGICF